MGRTSNKLKRERLNIWILANQGGDIAKLRLLTGKTKTEIVVEALAVYFQRLHEQGVL